MYEGYLTINGTEVLNVARAAAYIRSFTPRLDVKCEAPDKLRTMLRHAPYVSPAKDNAPWYDPARPETGRFYGLFPGTIEGTEDGTRTVDSEELTGDGAVHSMPRHGAKEIRVTALAVAADEEALSAGMAWLRDVMDNTGCNEGELDCRGMSVTMLAALPGESADNRLFRHFYDVEAIEAPFVTKEFSRKASASAYRVEFVLEAGVPWAFTPTTTVGLLDMAEGAASFTDPAGEDCSEQNDSYKEFINDPYYTAISQPPRPPVIKPPNILKINSWRRRTLALPPTMIKRWGRTVPVVSVIAGKTAPLKQLRLRFYEESAGVSGCDYTGEFIVSYLPAGASMTIDGIHREATVQLANGKVVPGSHLLFGSDGRPFQWPTMGCHTKYTMTADLMPGQTGISVLLEAAVRE